MNWQTDLDQTLAGTRASQDRLRLAAEAVADRAAAAISTAVAAAEEQDAGPRRGARTRAVEAVAAHRGVTAQAVWAAVRRHQNAAPPGGLPCGLPGHMPPLDLARTAAEAVHGIATLSPGAPGWSSPGDAHDLTLNLATVAHDLGVAMERTDRLLQELHDGDRIVSRDGEEKTAGQTTGAQRYARHAAERAFLLAEALRDASVASSGLTLKG